MKYLMAASFALAFGLAGYQVDTEQFGVTKFTPSINIHNNNEVKSSEVSNADNLTSLGEYFEEKLNKQGIHADYMKDKEEVTVNGITFNIIEDTIPKELTTIQHEGKNIAKIMFEVSAFETNGNLDLAQKVSDKTEEVIPGVTRGVLLNEDPNIKESDKNVIKVILGSKGNTLKEKERAVDIMVDVLKEYIK